MKRLVAIALTLILCLSLCSFAAAEETDVYGKYEEPIKLTILSEDFKTGNTNYDANDPRRASATQNVWIDAYKDYLNIDVERQIAEDETALAALINTAMASGDLPDVIICNKAMFYTLVENGVLQDVRAAYEGYQQKRLVKDALDSLDMWDACTVDGQLLAVPCVNNFYNNTQILWIRQDWLDKVNMEPPPDPRRDDRCGAGFQGRQAGRRGYHWHRHDRHHQPQLRRDPGRLRCHRRLLAAQGRRHL